MATAVEKTNMVSAIAGRTLMWIAAMVTRIMAARTTITAHWTGAISARLMATRLRLNSTASSIAVRA